MLLIPHTGIALRNNGWKGEKVVELVVKKTSGINGRSESVAIIATLVPPPPIWNCQRVI